MAGSAKSLADRAGAVARTAVSRSKAAVSAVTGRPDGSEEDGEGQAGSLADEDRSDQEDRSGASGDRSATEQAAPSTRKTPAPGRTTAKQATAKKATAKKTTAKKAPAKQATATKAPAKKAAPEKVTAKQVAPEKASVKKAAPEKASAKKASAKKATPTKSTAGASAGRSTTKQAAGKSASTSGGRSSAAGGPSATAPHLVVLDREDPWSEAEVAEVRAQLTDDVERLVGELAEVEGDLAGMIENSGEGAGHDQADVGSASFERDQERLIVNNARDMLEQSRHALDRIEDGSYGRCEVCGNAIGKNRLMAFPRATLCLTCKQREERR